MKLLTWNIQAGIGTRRYRDYLLHAHRQVIHTAAKNAVLGQIAREVTPFDVVCLQEVDLGGRRAGYRSQVEMIAQGSGHSHAAVQQNRVVPGVSRHGNAILSRWPLRLVEDMKLPGRLAGRGCLIVDVEGPVRLRVACLHLSLGAADQMAQLEAIRTRLDEAPNWVAMGDFNCGAGSRPLTGFCRQVGAGPGEASPRTYPSWRPRRDFDHILGSRGLTLGDYRAEPLALSDHLPVSASLFAG
ncbi:endonuclease/exonuclease/phosphatase family protein [Novosphingobium terrae]|uniref:endonuclease/exonuclease/phosphatase family protein n=1 Tax=Novosphingobium terrae TaxID=2726189 RepID=UPI0019822EAB|nr:endonuclease/exonuclease/phosphatase family protein [Novosphingobium terrae]